MVVKYYKLFDRVKVSCLKNDRCLQWIWPNVCSKLALDAIRHVRFTFYNFPYSVLAQCSTKFLSCHRIFSGDIHFHILSILKYRGRGRIRKYSLLMKSQTTADKWPYYALSYPIKSSLTPHNIRTVWRTLVSSGEIAVTRHGRNCAWRSLLRNLTIQIIRPIPQAELVQAQEISGRQTDRQTCR